MRSSISIIFITALLALGCTPNPKEKTLYQLKSATTTGVTFNNRIVETDSSNILNEEYIFNGGGVAVGDFDGDGKSDLFFSGNQVANKLYLNKGDFIFEDVSETAGIGANDQWCTGVTVVDINTDGKLDIYVCAARELPENKRANLLFVNQGNNANGVPEFKEMSEAYGINEKGNSMGAAFFDYNGDGHLDLYVINNEQVHVLPTNYRKKVVDGTAETNDRLYRNNGNGTFEDVTLEAGILYEGFGLGLAISDINYDGWPDIYVNNDYLTNDLLYINNGNGTFTNKIDEYIKHQSKFAMGSDISDFNNDGYLDLITLDMLGETNYRMKTTMMGKNYIGYTLNERYGYQYQYMRNMLQLGNGKDVPFNEIGLLSGVSRTDWSWAPLFIDVDNDGLRDLLITNGFPRDITDMDFSDFRLSVSQYLSPSKILDSIPVVKIANYAYKNKGDLTFQDVGQSWGLNIPSFSNGAAFADLDNDGDLDYIVNNINDEAFLFENTLEKTSTPANFLKIRLAGQQDNPMGIGTKVQVNYKGGSQYYDHNLTRGYMSSVDETIHFGLKDQDTVSLNILWPDGRFEVLEAVPTNQTLTVRHDNSSNKTLPDGLFSQIKKIERPVFKEVSGLLNINYEHQEKDIIDYNVQGVLPHKLSQNGPCLAKGDFNGDGLEDFVIGSSSGYTPFIYFQKEGGSFQEKAMFTTKAQMLYEEESIAAFDLENDGDLDLYLVSGSNEFFEDMGQYQDRLFLNDGNGNFTQVLDKSPTINASGSIVRACDYDHDGFTDLFVGGRSPFGKYPLPDKSFMLKNDNGILKDVTSSTIPELKELGMVTDALWVDINGDQLEELIIVGELMPITLFKNNKTSFTRMKNTQLEDYLGWWESIEKGDFDNDGDQDFIVGNIGRNNFYQPSLEHPVTLIAKDFDANGSIDPIMFAYFKDLNGTYRSFPVHFWGDLSKQSPIFRSKFSLYKEFASTPQEDFFTEEERKGALKLKGNYDRSIYVENLGNGQFKPHELPIASQFAPINAMRPLDYNADGNLDVLLVGNNFGNEIFIGRLDALNGLLLEGNGSGKFTPVSTKDSGFLVPGDAKAMVEIKNENKGYPMYIISQNRDSLKVFAPNLDL